MSHNILSRVVRSKLCVSQDNNAGDVGESCKMFVPNITCNEGKMCGRFMCCRQMSSKSLLSLSCGINNTSNIL